MAGLGEVVGDEGADVAAAGDDDPHQCDPPCAGPAARCASNPSTRRRARRRGSRRRPGPPGRGLGIWATPSRVRPTMRQRSVGLDVEHRGAGPRRPGSGRSTSITLALGSTQSDGGPVREDAVQHPLGGPLHGGDGRDADPLVDGGAAGVVDAGHHPLDAEGLPGHPGHEDVRVVAVGDGGQCAGLLDAGVPQPVAVEADPDDGLAGEVLAEAVERLLAGDRSTATVWPISSQARAETRSDPAAPDDDDVHLTTSSPPAGARGRTLRSGQGTSNPIRRP